MDVVELRDFLGTGATQIVDPQVVVESETECPDHVRRLLSYRVEADDRCFAWLLIPRPMPARSVPLVICPHQTKPFGKDGPVGLADEEQYHYALHLVREGFMCFAPDEFSAGQRLKAGQRAYDTYELYRRHPRWSAAGKSLWDLQRALDFLVRYEGVEASRIGAIGHSLGGHDSLVLAAFDERITAAVINCGVPLLRTEPYRKEWARGGEHEYVYYPSLRPFMDRPESLPFDFDRVAMRVAPRRLLMIHAMNDQYMQNNAGWLEASRAVSDHFDRLGCTANFSVYFHRRTHALPAEARALAYQWLKGALHG